MTAPVATATKAGDKKAQIPLRPFKVGAQSMDDTVYDTTVTTGASTQRLPLYNVPSNAFLEDIYILVQATTVGNAAAVTFAADGPWIMFDTIRFTDTNNADLVGPCNGWELYVINKYGGYRFSDDPKASPIYSVTTGAGATGGSFTFCLRLPVELVPRDALGALVNKSASTPYRVVATVAATATIYGVTPTAPPSIRIRMTPINYWQPTPQDGSGNPVAPQPPGMGTTQYWNVTPITINAGAINEPLTASTGFPVRNLVFVLRDSTGSRATGETDFPDPFRLQLQSNVIVDRIKLLWQHYMAQDYGYTAALSDTVANAKDNGVYVVPFCKDFYPKPGWENRRTYLRTTDGMRLNMQGTVGGAGSHTMTVLTNYVGVGAGATLAQLTT